MWLSLWRDIHASKAPFESVKYSSPLSKLKTLATVGIPSLKTRGDDVPHELSGLVDQFLSEDASARPECPLEVATALEPFTAGNNLAALVSETSSSMVRAEPGSTDSLRSEFHETDRGIEPSKKRPSAVWTPPVCQTDGQTPIHYSWYR